MEIDDEIVSRCKGQFDSNQLALTYDRRKQIEESSSVILSVAPVFSITAAIFSILSISFLIWAIVRRRLPNRKYSVIVSRSVGDLFSAVLVAAVSLMANKNSASFAVLALFLYVTTFGFLQLSLSHILVIILRQISLFRPYGFESAFSLRKLVGCLVVLWLLSIFYAAAFAPLTTVILDPRKAEGVCSYFSCQRPLIIIAIALVAFLMMTVLLFYAAVAYKLYNTSVQERLSIVKGIYSQVHFSLRLHNEPNITRKKLHHFMAFGGHIVLYVLICSLLLAGAIIIQNNIWLFHQVQIAETCSLIEYLNTMIRLETIAGGAVLLWMVRIVADIAVLWVSDYRRLLPWISRNEPRILPNNQIGESSMATKSTTRHFQLSRLHSRENSKQMGL